MERDFGRDLRVGLFLVMSVVLLSVFIFMLGGQDGMFKERYTLHSSFTETAGLRDGAVVRLAGIDVGEVSLISFPEDTRVKAIQVQMEVMVQYQERIRADSVGTIETEGMLGDKYISITVGTPSEPRLESGATLPVEEGTSLEEYERQARGVLHDVSSITERVNGMLIEADGEEPISLVPTIRAVEAMMVQAETGEGLVHQLFYDEVLPRKINKTFDELDTTVARLESTLAEVEAGMADLAKIVDEVESGDGLAHQLVYGEEGTTLANDLAELSSTLQGVVADIEGGEGMLTALIYDEELKGTLDDLASAADDLQILADGLEQGDGTLGLLMTDPTLYEDMRVLVGGAQRNKLLRTAVRSSIKKAEDEDVGAFGQESAP